MSQEGLIKFLTLIESDNALRKELESSNTLQEKLAIATTRGCDVQEADLAVLRGDGKGQLSDAELDLVAGGGIFGRIWNWAKEHITGSGKDGNYTVSVKGTHDVGGGR